YVGSTPRAAAAAKTTNNASRTSCTRGSTTTRRAAMVIAVRTRTPVETASHLTGPNGNQPAGPTTSTTRGSHHAATRELPAVLMGAAGYRLTLLWARRLRPRGRRAST